MQAAAMMQTTPARAPPIAGSPLAPRRQMRSATRCRTYRWSPDREGAEGRKRESLFDNAEPDALREDDDDGEEAAGAAGAERWDEPPRGARGGGNSAGAAPRRRARRAAAAGAAWGEAADGEEEEGGNGESGDEESEEWGPAAARAAPAAAGDDLGWASEPWAPGAGAIFDDDDDGGGAPPPPRRGGTRVVDAAGGAATEEAFRPSSSSDGGSNGGGPSSPGGGAAEPDIALLSPRELDRVLPAVPLPAQASFFDGGAGDAVQRWAAALAATVLLSKAAVLAAGSLTAPLWWPWARAAAKNWALRRRAGYAGLWRCRVLDVQTGGRPRPAAFGGAAAAAAGAPPPRFGTMRSARVTVGDAGGARVEVVLPYDARYEAVRPGDAAELLVLSATPRFEAFSAVKDAYLPAAGLWLTEYPFLDRAEFLEVSLDVEREEAAAAAARARAGARAGARGGGGGAWAGGRGGGGAPPRY